MKLIFLRGAPALRLEGDLPLMEETRTLDRLAAGRRAVVAELTAPEDQRRRLQELGFDKTQVYTTMELRFVPGGRVEVVQESPWGDPVAYAVCGAVIALRRSDARQILVAAD